MLYHSLLAVCLLVVGTSAERANIILHKTVVNEPDCPDGIYRIDSNFTVRLDLYNVGDGVATDVELSDMWPVVTEENKNAFSLIDDGTHDYTHERDGTIDMILEPIEAGEKKTIELGILCNFAGTFPGARATLRYKPSPDDEVMESYSTAMQAMSVLTTDAYRQYFENHMMEYVVFFTSAVALIFVPLWFQMQVKWALESKMIQ